MGVLVSVHIVTNVERITSIVHTHDKLHKSQMVLFLKLVIVLFDIAYFVTFTINP